MAGKINHQAIPFFSEYTLEELQEWYTSDPESFEAWAKDKIEAFHSTQKNLRPGQPNPYTFEWGETDPDYERAVQEWQEGKQVDMMETAFGRAIFKSQPPKPIDANIHALGSKNATDRATAAEVLQFKDVISRLEKKSQHLRNNGHIREALETEQMLAGYQEHIGKLYTESPYSFVEEDRKAHLEQTMKELEAASNLSPKEVEANREHWEGLIEAYNLSNDTEDHSFVIDGSSPYDPDRPSEARVKKVGHEGASGTRMAQSRNGQSTLDTLIRQGFGRAAPPVKEKAKATEEDEEGHPLESATTHELEKFMANKGVSLF